MLTNILFFSAKIDIKDVEIEPDILVDECMCEIWLDGGLLCTDTILAFARALSFMLMKLCKTIETKPDALPIDELNMRYKEEIEELNAAWNSYQRGVHTLAELSAQCVRDNVYDINHVWDLVLPREVVDLLLRVDIIREFIRETKDIDLLN